MNKNTFHVLFVCTGNLCRSPMAEGILRRLLKEKNENSIEVRSAGLFTVEDRPAEPFAVDVCMEKGIDISEHRSTLLTTELVEWADVILVMEKSHLFYIQNLIPQAKEKTFLLGGFGISSSEKEIEDPIGQDIEAYRNCCETLEAEIQKILPKLLELAKTKEGPCEETSSSYS